MEGQVAKRRRVYSVEPNQIVQSIFTRNYLNHLIPALVKIKEEKSSSSIQDISDINNAVKYEVDMAMVMSAQGFAWTNGLKLKLQSDHVHVNNAANKSTSFIETEAAAGVPMELSSKSQQEKMDFKCNKDMTSQMKRDIDDNEDENINNQWKRLRGLMPGGEEMCDDDEQMVSELESYITCLQMQVNALQFLLPQTR